MTTLQKILESKRALRRELACRPVAEKLRMLEAMREGALAITTTAKTSSRARSSRNP
jgi:hypothetical protein